MTKSDCSLSAEYSLRLPFLDFCALFCLFPTPSFYYYLLGVCALSSNLDWGWEMGNGNGKSKYPYPQSQEMTV